jgi:hypothetical protein
VRFIAVALVWSAFAQELPPEVLLLARLKTHMRTELANLPNYTCLESLNQYHRDPDHLLKLQHLGTVHLDIIYSNNREWYGVPGGKNFGTDNPVRFIASGMVGTGAFALLLHNVFEIGLITYKGEEDLGGRKTVRYDYRLPNAALEITIPGGKGTVGEAGSFWVDRETLDLIRMDSHAINIPGFLPLKETYSVGYYARTQLGENLALLPQRADLYLAQTNGAEGYDRLDFTHCRAFSADTAIRFDVDGDEDKAGDAKAIGAAPDAIRELLSMTVELMVPIKGTDPVGTVIEARVSGDVVRKGRVLVPGGSPVRGRIRRLERNLDADESTVGLEFTEIQVKGTKLRFYADFVRVDKSAGLRMSLAEEVLVKSQRIRLPELPGVASFVVPGTTFVVPRGLRMVWRTRGLSQ